ncbi:MAG: recombinase family protein [Deltaproteobacteria bacterium]|nr:recombinase family protein [Deltaproteobacteria bacterium]
MPVRNGNNGNANGGGNGQSIKPIVRCAIYTRKSTDENLDNDFNSLDAQRESAENFIKSQQHEGWIALPDRYDDPAYSGATLERPALQRLMQDIEAGKIDTVVIYKIDRLSRSLLDFTKLIEKLDARNVTLVSVTQQFNTTTSMGRLTLNILLSFAQFEREVITERIRDKVAAAKRRGKYMGGTPPIGYDVDRVNKRLLVNPEEATLVRFIFRRFVQIRSTTLLSKELNGQGHHTKAWVTVKGRARPGIPWHKGHLYRLLNNLLYLGLVAHKDQTYPGEHEAIIDRKLWDEAHKILAENLRSRGQRTRSKTPALLRGVIRCAHCDSGMGITYTAKKGRQYRYYLCVKADKRGYDTCPVRTLPAAEIEEAVVNQLRAVFRSPELIAKTFKNVRGLEEEERKRLEQLKAEIGQRLAVLRSTAARLPGPRTGNSDLARSELTGLDGDIKAAERDLKLVEADLAGLEDRPSSEEDVLRELTALDSLWDNLFPLEQERIIHLLVEKVLVHKDGIEVSLRSDGLHSLNRELQGRELEAPCAK